MPIPPLVLSALLWIAFIVYWNVAAVRDLTRGGAAPTINAESPESRQLHQRLMYGALVCALAFHFPPLLSFAYWRKIRIEEARLHTVFGEQYATYARQSHALLPGIL